VPTRALSVCQPWAWAIAAGFKVVENRTCSTPYRGPVAIHASTSYGHLTLDNDIFLQASHPDIKAALLDPAIIEDDDLEKCRTILHLGSLIGVAELVDIVHYRGPVDDEKLRAAAKAAGCSMKIDPVRFADPGAECWLFRNAVEFTLPIPCKGKLNVWGLDDGQRAAVAKAMSEAVTRGGGRAKPAKPVWAIAMKREQEAKKAAQKTQQGGDGGKPGAKSAGLAGSAGSGKAACRGSALEKRSLRPTRRV
jgi:hypothetical protein